jgi:RNA polymerase sigma factor (sigma-70 family)
MVAEDQASSTEVAAQNACRRGDYGSAATLVLRAYSGEIYSFLLAQFRGNEGRSDDVFAEFSEDFWRALPKFEWRCSIRAWCYKLARSAASRSRRSPHNRRERRVPLSDAPFLQEFIQVARESTQPHLRTEVKDQFQRLRDRLEEDERDLLILRVDRELSWRDVAHAMLGPDEVPDDERLRRFEVTLRQRFTEVKKRLRTLAEEEGLL